MSSVLLMLPEEATHLGPQALHLNGGERRSLHRQVFFVDFEAPLKYQRK